MSKKISPNKSCRKVSADKPDERFFLTETRRTLKEKERLKRIHDEFEHAFKELYSIGPAVTVFGSARFKENHEYYKMARTVGAELARVGLATITGGAPGIMEAANRGAHEAGGELRSRKGLNLPGIELGISAFTERDPAGRTRPHQAGARAVVRPHFGGRATLIW